MSGLPHDALSTNVKESHDPGPSFFDVSSCGCDLGGSVELPACAQYRAVAARDVHTVRIENVDRQGLAAAKGRHARILRAV